VQAIFDFFGQEVPVGTAHQLPKLPLPFSQRQGGPFGKVQIQFFLVHGSVHKTSEVTKYSRHHEFKYRKKQGKSAENTAFPKWITATRGSEDFREKDTASHHLFKSGEKILCRDGQVFPKGHGFLEKKFFGRKGLG
jgi:hypothetical protein